MNPQRALAHLHKFLETHPDARPGPQFRIGIAQQVSVTGESFYLIGVVDEREQPVPGSSAYYIFPDGTVLISGNNPGDPEQIESAWLRWKSQILLG